MVGSNWTRLCLGCTIAGILHWNGNVIILTKISSPAAPLEVVKITETELSFWKISSKWHFRFSVRVHGNGCNGIQKYDNLLRELRNLGPVSISDNTSFFRSRYVSKAWDRVLKCSYRFDISRAHRQQCCREACQIPNWLDNFKCKFRHFARSYNYTSDRILKQDLGGLSLLKPILTQMCVAISCHQATMG